MRYLHKDTLRTLIKLIFSVSILFVGILILCCRMGPLPALGNFFSPYYGIWPHFKETKLQSLLQTDAISAETEVFSDQRKVPHIFSKNKESLYFTFGYVTAQDRLFQMYLTSRAAEGRVSEIIGPQALPYDKMMREINFKASTQKMISAAYSESELKSYVGAYVNGVNAYIKTLTPQTMPWEFLFFDVKLPEWRLLDSTLIYQNINWEMSKTTTSRTYSALLKKTDLNHLLELFPYFSSFTVPIFPDKKRLQDALGKKMSHDDAVISQQLVSDEANQSNIFKTCSAEEAQETCTLARSAYTSAAPTKDQQVLKILHEAMNGSNNWVLSGKKTKNGYPLLANDPHLNLTIPSVWYEAQLSSGDLNVYGVTLPGIPFIAIGFNKNIAWGITNGADNAIEYYSVKTQTNNNNEKEFYNGEKWEKLSSRTEQIFTKQKEPVLYKIYETPHGSISNLEGHSFDVSIPESSVMRWNNDNLGQEFKAFYNINRAKNYSEFVSAISLHVSPFFNFAFAARDGDIALWHQGKFKEHKKPAPIIVQDYVQLNKVTDDFINVSDNPHLLNPESDYIYSANQEPVSSTYPYFFPGKYESYSRPNRINDVLKNLKQATPQDMMRLQNDNMSLYARDFLSKFFSLKLNNYNFSSVEKDALKILEKWDYFYSADSIAATLFDEWQTSLRKFLWASLFFEADGKMLSLPSYERNLEFFNNPDLKLWFTAENLEAQLTYNQILSLSFKEALQKLSKNKNWEFRKVLALNIPNVARLPGFGENNLLIGGSEYSPNAVEYSPKAHGPSWRMVVSFKKDGLDAWGVLPGGASGNPASPNYAYAVGSWAKGEYYPLLFMQDKPMSSPTQKFETSQ